MQTDYENDLNIKNTSRKHCPSFGRYGLRTQLLIRWIDNGLSKTPTTHICLQIITLLTERILGCIISGNSDLNWSLDNFF